MSKKLLGVIIGLISLVALGSIIYFTRLPTENSNTAQSPSVDSTAIESAETETKVFTRDEVAEHNTKEDCWTIIDKKVYDISAYIPRHPGGDEILRACGNDGSSLFNSRKTESGEEIGSGSPHSSSAMKTLSRFQVGTVSD